MRHDLGLLLGGIAIGIQLALGALRLRDRIFFWWHRRRTQRDVETAKRVRRVMENVDMLAAASRAAADRGRAALQNGVDAVDSVRWMSPADDRTASGIAQGLAPIAPEPFFVEAADPWPLFRYTLIMLRARDRKLFLSGTCSPGMDS